MDPIGEIRQVYSRCNNTWTVGSAAQHLLVCLCCVLRFWPVWLRSSTSLEPSGVVKPDDVYPLPHRSLRNPVREGEATGHYHGGAG